MVHDPLADADLLVVRLPGDTELMPTITRPCPGCKVVLIASPARRCPACTVVYDRARGSRSINAGRRARIIARDAGICWLTFAPSLIPMKAKQILDGYRLFSV